MNVSRLAAAIAESRKAGLLHRGLKILNLVNTARGAITTVLLAASAIGGAATVQQVTSREAANPDQGERASLTRLAPRPSASPSPSRSPVTPASVRADAEARVQTALQQQAAAVDDLRKVTVLGAARFDQLVADTKARLQQRADLAMTQIAELAAGAAPSARSAAGGSPAPSFNIITLNSLVQLAVGDMNGMVIQATRVATTVPPPPPTVAPTVVPTTPPPPTPRPTPPPPSRSPSPSPRR